LTAANEDSDIFSDLGGHFAVILSTQDLIGHALHLLRIGLREKVGEKLRRRTKARI